MSSSKQKTSLFEKGLLIGFLVLASVVLYLNLVQ